jgi:calpain-15
MERYFFIYVGNWSDKSPLWTPELKEKLKFVDADDGTFWMNVEDFHQNFGQVCSCKYNKDYVYSFAKLAFPVESRYNFLLL